MNLIANNKKALWNYEILKTYTAGIVLKGSEVKSIRAKNINMRDSYARFIKGELFLINLHIAAYKGSQNHFFNHNPTDNRKLLLNKRELEHLFSKTREKGLAIVPTQVYINEKNLVKIDIGLAKGKKSYDKRSTLKEKEIQLTQNKEIKQWVSKKSL